MIITATEFKMNLGKYLELVSNEDVFITKNGKIIAKLTVPQSNKIAALRSLVGIAKGKEDVSLDEIKKERLKRQWKF